MNARLGGKSSRLFVSTFGTGRPMLCVHGIEAHGLRYADLAARFPGLGVVAPDLRGHGRSPRVGPWTLEQQMGDLLPPLTSFAEPILLLGHSYGGLLAWELARAAPASVAALLLVDPAIAVSAELARVSMSYEASSLGHSGADVGEAFRDLAAGRPASGAWAAALDAALAMEVGSDGRLHPLVVGDAVTAGWSQMQEPLRASSWRGPTLLIEAGREDGRFVSSDVVLQMREQLGDSLDHRVLDATHTIPSDYPDVLASAVREFLTGQSLLS